MRPLDDKLEDLARLVGDTADAEIDCAEMLNLVSSFLQKRQAGEALPERLRAVGQHLKICPECREEFDALIRAEGLDPRAILGEGT